MKGITNLNGHLYLVFAGSTSISVYSAAKPFTLQHRITAEAIRSPRDIIACPRNECLYVADACGIWRVNGLDVWKSEQKTDCKLWLKSITVKALSSARDGNILVTELERLCMFDYNGEMVYEVPLDRRGLRGVYHAVEMPNGTLVICQTDTSEDFGQRILAINQNGELLRSYGGKAGDEYGQLNGPCYAVRDADHGWLFVADYVNHRVLLFDGDLKCHGVLVKHAMDFTMKLCYVRYSKRLVLGMSFHGFVEIYRIFENLSKWQS